ncbi:MAG: DUF2189 domain-containing protein [Gammaproteobacteria bacterium]
MAQPDIRSGSDLESNALPYVAPSRIIDTNAPLRWLKLGWEDYKQAPGVSLLYGGFLVLISYILAFFTWKLGGYILLFSLMSGFVFIAPVLAIGLYSISCQLQAGLKPKLGYCLREGKRHLGNELVYSMILLVLFMLWARAGSVTHIFFPDEGNPAFSDLALFLSIGSVVGAIFATLVFSTSAFSLPMMLDRKVDAVTAVLTSVSAVRRNKAAMALWAGIILLAVILSFATAFLGLAVFIPVIGYATWHGYQDTILAEQWPENSKPGDSLCSQPD